MKVLTIKDWDKNFENHDTRKIKNLDWIPLKVNLDNSGLLDILNEKDGESILGIWILLIESSTKCSKRGQFMSKTNTPYDIKKIAELARTSQIKLKKALKILEKIGWVEFKECENLPFPSQDSAVSNGDKTGECREIAATTTALQRGITAPTLHNSNIRDSLLSLTLSSPYKTENGRFDNESASDKDSKQASIDNKKTETKTKPEPLKTIRHQRSMIPASLDKPEFLVVWNRWIENWCQKGKPITVAQQENHLLQLARMKDIKRAIDTIENSISVSLIPKLFEPFEQTNKGKLNAKLISTSASDYNPNDTGSDFQ